MSPELSAVLSRLVDPRLGIIRRISDVPLQPGEPHLFILAANCTRPKYFLRNAGGLPSTVDYAVPANAVAFTREEALWRLIGEACERYTGGIYSDAALVTASRASLSREAFPVENLIAFSNDQYRRSGFPFVRFDPRAPIRWVSGWNLTQEQRCFIPAVLVYLGYEARNPLEAFYPTMSTGMAAGRTLEQAILNGLCEVVERDAFMCTWLLRRSPPRIRQSTLQSALAEHAYRLFESECAEASVAVVRTDISLPAAITVLRARGGGGVVIGAAASTSLHQAVVRSALEAFHTLNWSIFLDRSPKRLEREDVRDFEDHVRYYLDPRHRKAVSWLYEGPEQSFHLAPRHSADHSSQLRQAIKAVADAGYDVYYVETTTPDIRALGLRTARVLVPGLHPLNVGHGTVHEDTRRLDRVAAHWQLDPGRPLNRDPHPFP